VTPSFAKIGALPKLMNSHSPTAAEEISLHHLAELGRITAEIYPPGLNFVNLSDARLYNTYLGNPEPVVARYGRGLGEIIDRGGLAPFVRVVYYDDLLADRSHAFQRIYADSYRLYREDPSPFFVDSDRGAIFQSLHASLCLKHLPMTYDDYKAVFGPAPDPSNPFHPVTMEMAEEALARKMSIRAACRALEADVFGDHFPGALRGTIHRIHDPAQPVIGLRIFPDYYRACRLLPYHGCMVVFRHHGRVRTAVHPEIRLRANPKLVRVTHRDYETYFYTPADPEQPTDALGIPS
jgi:Pyoverdine/dityrosine biosynthesis protein